MDENIRLHDAEYRFASLVWESEPIPSGELAKKAEEVLGWKRTTSYTVLKKLCDKGVLQNDKAQVTALIKQEQVLHSEGQALLDKGYGGSLPLFVAAYLKQSPLSKKEYKQLKRLIEQAQEDGKR